MQGADGIQDNTSRELIKSYNQHAKELINIAEVIFQGNNLDAQFFLLTQLVEWQQKDFIQDNPELKALFAQKLKSLVIICTNEFSNNEPNQYTTQAQFDYVRSLKNHPELLIENTDLAANFIQQSKQLFVNQHQYMERFHVITGILKAWEAIQDKLTLTDLAWLEQATQDITCDYRQLPTRYYRITAEITQYLEFLNIYKGIIAAVGTTVGSILGMQYWLFVKFAEARRNAVNFVTDFYQAQRDEPNKYTAEEWEKLNQLVNTIVNSYHLQGDNLERARGFIDTNETITRVFPYAVTTIAVGGSYLVHRFFSQPVEPQTNTFTKLGYYIEN